MKSRLFRGLILAAGVATLGLLLWKLEPARVWELLRRIGWGWLLIIPGHGVDHVFNAWGWKFAFSAKDADRVSLGKIYVARIAGDGVNYLTPAGPSPGRSSARECWAAKFPRKPKSRASSWPNSPKPSPKWDSSSSDWRFCFNMD